MCPFSTFQSPWFLKKKLLEYALRITSKEDLKDKNDRTDFAESVFPKSNTDPFFSPRH